MRDETRTFLGFFTRLGASRSESEDLTQETFLKLFRLAQKHDSDPSGSGAESYDARGRFRGYAFRVARNVWIDRSRKRANQPVATGTAAPDDEAAGPSLDSFPDRAAPLPEGVLEQREESDRIRAAVASLSAAHAAVFELGVVQGLPYSEIAASLDIPVGTVKSRMYNAVHRVRDALQEESRVRDEISGRARRSSTLGAPPSGYQPRPGTL